eukprot:SAG31_NODE_16575_length_703_cov_1.447020_2_plen_113_part_00
MASVLSVCVSHVSLMQEVVGMAGGVEVLVQAVSRHLSSVAGCAAMGALVEIVKNDKPNGRQATSPAGLHMIRAALDAAIRGPTGRVCPVSMKKGTNCTINFDLMHPMVFLAP